MRSALKLCVLALLLLTGCVALPAPAPERSILALPANMHKVYLPITPGNFSLGKGVGLTYGNCEDANQLGATWYINWGTTSSGCTQSMHLPMVWGAFKNCPLLQANAPLILGFNEPDRPDQANLTPDEAARLWYQLTVICYPDAQFSTPMPVNDLTWLDAFYNAYVTRYEVPPRASVLALHCYSWTDASVCLRLFEAARVWGHARGIYKFLVTEWAILPCGIGLDQALIEAEIVRTWLRAQSDFIGYAWFAARINGDEWWALKPQPQCYTGLFNTAGITAWGKWYQRKD